MEFPNRPSIRLYILDLPLLISKCDQPAAVAKIVSPAHHKKSKSEVYAASRKLPGESYTYSGNPL